MKKMHTRQSVPGILLLFLLALGLATAGCYVRARAGHGGYVEAGADVGYEYDVDNAPPPPQDEAVIAQPGPDYIWIAGGWDWSPERHSYLWAPGRWEHGRSEEVWVAPRYETRGSRHVFTRGHWAKRNGREGDRDRG